MLTALSFAEGLRCDYHSSLRRTEAYASFIMTAHALHSSIFEHPFGCDFPEIFFAARCCEVKDVIILLVDVHET